MRVGSGDLDGLKALFAEDVTFVGDGGGKARTARKVVRGRDAVARGSLGGVRFLDGNARIELVDVNGWPGLCVWVGERLEGVVSIECDDQQIQGIHVILNPDKLRP